MQWWRSMGERKEEEKMDSVHDEMEPNMGELVDT